MKTQEARTFIMGTAPELEPWLMVPDRAENVHPIFADMALRLSRYGSLSEKQIAFARKLFAEYNERQVNGGRTNFEIKRDAERALAEDCPKGRVQINGEIVKLKEHQSQYGVTEKMIVKDDRGFLVWCTVPSALFSRKMKGFPSDPAPINSGPAVGDRVSFIATITPSDKDAKFGFGKRPVVC